MESKHTPGPWVLIQHGDYADIKSSCPWEWDIASVIGAINKKSGEDSTESVANARLIAAAPDLLDAIQCALNLKDLWSAQQSGTVSADHEGEMQALQEMQNKLEAAYIKATGELIPVNNQ